MANKRFGTFDRMGNPEFDPIPEDAVFPVNLVQQGKEVHLSYIGMGASATIHLLEFLNLYVKNFKEDPNNAIALHINIFDRSGKWTIGGEHVYDPSNITFTLNQPAILMGIDYQNQLVHWLAAWHQRKDPEQLAIAEQKFSGYKKQGLSDERISYIDSDTYLIAKKFGPYDYIPRALYGKFLYEILQAKLQEVKAVANAACGFNGNNDGDEKNNIFSYAMVQQNVEEFSLTHGNSFIVNVGEECECRSDLLVAATGHLQGGLLGKLENKPGYAHTPFTIGDIENAVAAHPAGPVVIIGTGQATLDALAALEGIDYKGKIVAVSGDLVEPWPRDATIPYAEKSPFRFQNFALGPVEDAIKNFRGDYQNPELIAQLRGLIQKDMHSDEAIKCCPSNVIRRFYEMQEAYAEIMQDCPDIFKACQDLFHKHAGNPTSPTRFALYKKMRASGQLELIQGKALDKQSNATDTGFEIAIENAGAQQTIPCGIVLNCASMTKSPWDRTGKIVNPALRSLEKIGVISRDEVTHSLVPSDNDGRVVLIGPAGGGPWGIPYTRNDIKEAAQKTFTAALNICQSLYAQCKSELKIDRNPLRP